MSQVDMPKWWNWQTRRTQNPVRLKPRAGSTPAFGTRIFSPELTEFRAFLLPDSLYSGVFRVKCEDRICRRNLTAIIKVGVNI